LNRDRSEPAGDRGSRRAHLCSPVLDRCGHLLSGAEDRTNAALDALAEAATEERREGAAVVPIGRSLVERLILVADSPR
jgi:hypothetical protein